ncbi:MAG: DUF5667 domain-containing protein [Candidatus Spechtbacterales bacterium]
MTLQRFFITILIPALAIFALVGTVSAQEQEAQQLPNPGIAPDSPFYFLDIFFENIALVLTFDAEAKAKRHLAVSNERLAEAQKMAEEEKDEALQNATERYTKALEQFEERVAGLETAARERLNERVSQAAERQREALERIQERLQGRQDRADDEESDDSNEAVEAAAKTRVSLEIVSAATLKHIEVLERVRGEVNENAREAIDRNIERSRENRERLLQRLEEGGSQAEDDASDTDRDAQDRTSDEEERQREAREQAEEIAELERKAAEEAAARERQANDQEPEAQARTFTITADDNGYSASSALRVNQGDTVRLTFNVSENNVYYGGMQFVSGTFDTGTIAPGGSETVEFTASTTTTVSAYWPASDVLKWTATVVVQ